MAGAIRRPGTGAIRNPESSGNEQGGQLQPSAWNQGLWRQTVAAANPALAGDVGAFRRSRAALPAAARGRTVAVIGRFPGSGTSTVAAVMALSAAAYTDSRVMVIETNAGQDRTGGNPRITAMLGGIGPGRLPALLAVPDGEAVARSRVRAAGTTGAAVPLLALPAEAGSFAPQVLEKTLARLKYRADLTIIDTPSDRGEPVFHAVLHLVDHVFLVLPADPSAPERLAAARLWLAAAPGPARRHGISVVLVGHRRRVPRWRPDDLPWMLLRRDPALRRAVPGRMSRRSVTTGLRLVATASAATTPLTPR